MLWRARWEHAPLGKVFVSQAPESREGERASKVRGVSACALPSSPTPGAFLLLHLCSWRRCGSLQGRTTKKKAITPRLLGPRLPIAPVLAGWARCCSATCCNVGLPPCVRTDGNWYLDQSSWGVGLDDPQRSLPIPTIPWFCELCPSRAWSCGFFLTWRFPLRSCCILLSSKVGLSAAKYLFFSCFSISWTLERKQPYLMCVFVCTQTWS